MAEIISLPPFYYITEKMRGIYTFSHMETWCIIWYDKVQMKGICTVENMILQTPRLVLRKMTKADWGDLCEILQDEQVMYAYEHAFCEQECTDWLNRQLERYAREGYGLFAVCLRDAGQMVGQCGLSLQPWQGREVLEVGYLFKKKAWKNGYAAEAARACRDYAFDTLGAEAVYSIIRENNLPSRRVALRNGMVATAHAIKQYYHMDMPHVLYCITREEWNKEKKINIRLRREEDFAFLFCVLKQNMQDLYREAFGKWEDIREEAFLRSELAKAPYWLIMRDNEPIGFFSVSSQKGNLMLNELQLKKGEQCRGLGSRILLKLSEYAAQKRSGLCLEVLKNNTRAIRLYQWLGFCITGQNKTHLQMEKKARKE